MPAFSQPFWLLIGLLACGGAVLFILLNNSSRKKKLEKIAAPHLLPLLTANVSPSRRRLKDSLFALGLACLFIALARPQLGHHWIEVRRKGIDILIGMDVSKSMLSPDIKPNRLARAKFAVRDFAAKLNGDRIGLLPFAGTAFLLCPLTTDYEAFNASLDSLETGSVPKGGTDIGAAIAQAGKALADDANHKIFILVTDGEDLSETALKAADAAKKQNMTIHTVGVGTPQGELVPLPGGQAGDFVKDEQGKFVTSKLDEKTLASIAERTGGLHVPLGNAGQGFEAIYERRLTLIPKEEHEQRRRKVPIERFPWPIAAAIALLSVEFFLSERRRGGFLRLPSIITAGRRKLKQNAAAVLLVLLCAATARADEGGDLFHAGKYAEAAQVYQEALRKDSANPVLHFNLGTCLHKQGKYAEAADEFGKALATDDLSLQAKGYYNQGNSRYVLGVAAETSAPEQALAQWRQAKLSFEAALKLEPKSKNAAHNLNLVSKKISELEKKQKREEQSSQQCKNPQNGDKDGQQKENGGKQEQPKKQADQQKKDSRPQQGADPAGKENKARQGGKAAPEKDKPQLAEKLDEKSPPTATAQHQKQADDKATAQAAVERKMLGKMTEDEAKNLLNSLKDEQGELNFVPQEAADEKEVSRDW